MGGGVSAEKMRGTEEEIINLMMPLYYVPNCVLTVRDVQCCKGGWNQILQDTSPEYTRQKLNHDFKFSSCVSWFYHIFYDRLFDVHPLCKPLFVNGVDSIGKFLVQMMSMSLNQLEDKDKFKKSMQELAVRHCERGVKSVEYGIVGDVLFYSLAISLGHEVYTPAVDSCWKVLFSTMLHEIVPLCIAHERRGMVKRTVVRESSESRHTNPKEGETTQS
jgi:hemoglobin-like flavoprotein